MLIDSLITLDSVAGAGAGDSRPATTPFAVLTQKAERSAVEVFLDGVLSAAGYVPPSDQQIPNVTISGNQYETNGPDAVPQPLPVKTTAAVVVSILLVVLIVKVVD